MRQEPTISEVAERLHRTASLVQGSSVLRYVRGARAEALRRMGLTRVRDVLLNVPHRYLDFSSVVDIAHSDVGSKATIVATVDRVTLKRPRPRMQIVEVSVLDPTGVMQATFFRQPWLADQLRQGDVIALSGTVTFAYGFKEMKAPFMERLGGEGDPSSYARILPIHPTTEGVSAAWMRRIVSAALAEHADVCDILPAGLTARRRLMTLGRALREVHFPRTMALKDEARRRLAYDELLCLQLALMTRQGLEQRGITPTSHTTDGAHVRAVRSALPFALTGEQRRAADEVLADMAASRPMNRLLLGDVGTGKTAVAAVALAAVADTGSQAAMMAPTSVLAVQYAERLGPVLDAADVPWALVTGSTPDGERARIEAAVAAGRTSVVFGTTAILSDALAFAHLSLVVIDEQHRFGVDQRAALRRKGAGADLLAMTATPIPRTMALTFYGDMTCSRIVHRPNPGAGVRTTCIAPENLDLAYGAIREAHEQGRQAYVICPLVDDSDDGTGLDDVPDASLSNARTLHAAVATQQQLTHTLAGLRVGLLHGRLSATDKDAVMRDFRAGAIDVLVSTTVVEVGVDVPNATVMLVFDADRFGLATLHQLRGRVGRGDHAGQVFLSCAAKRNTPARRRLAALEATSDGFGLAELDLRIRHEGEVLGYRQSGGVSLRIADLAEDGDLITWAHEDATAIVEHDPTLRADEHVPLALEVQDRFGAYFEEVERT